MIDEKVARLQAKVFGLEVIGTLGLLLKAKKNGLIPAIKPSIELGREVSSPKGRLMYA